MEVNYDVVRPNLLVDRQNIYFSAKPLEIIPISRDIDEIVKRHIGGLKVTEGDYELIKEEKPISERREYSVPLKDYLDSLEEKMEDTSGPSKIKLGGEAETFGISYLISAGTFEGFGIISEWETLKKYLADPEKAFDFARKEKSIWRLDKRRTLKAIEREYQTLEQKIPRNAAELGVIDGLVVSTRYRTISALYFGGIHLKQLKAKSTTKIEKAKSDLIERLKLAEGPCLSFDAPGIYSQMFRLQRDAAMLITRYGDIITSSPFEWKGRLFKQDP